MRKMGRLGRRVRFGVIGIGSRGKDQLCTLIRMPDVDVPVVCDLYDDRVKRGQDIVEQERGYRPDGTKDYREVNARDDLDGVLIFSDWNMHIEMAVDAMRHGKRPAMEVGGASSVKECWNLVDTSEQTGVPCMLLENCCYNNSEMAILNMVKKGVFGEIVHCEGGYAHDLREEIGMGDVNRHYRLENFLRRNGDLYPTHELGPIAKILGINHGNRMLTLVSMASKSAGLHAWLRENRKDSPRLMNAQVNEGDVVTTIIKCANGETIVLSHDCTLPRSYSRRLMVRGTDGYWQEDGKKVFLEGKTRIAKGDWRHTAEPDEAYMEKYKHPLWKEYERFGLRGGHGGMDYLAMRAYVESVQDKTNPPIDVYDTAAWMAITCLSEQSVAMGGAPVPIPDFTNGKWINRGPNCTGDYSLEIIPR